MATPWVKKMIKHAQKKFVRLTALILLAVFAVIYATNAIIFRIATTQTVTDTLDEVVAIFSQDSNSTPPPNSLYAELTVDFNSNQIEIKKLNYDHLSFNKIDINKTIETTGLRSTSIKNGNIQKFFYIIDTSESTYRLYALDATSVFERFNFNALWTLIALVIIYVILVLITFASSFIVFKPILENFERQKQFISDASHELKTPITIISASADVLKSQGDNKWVNNIKEQTERMGALVTDMLALAKLEETVSLTKTEFDLSEEVINATLPFEAITFEHNQRIFYEVQENVKITTDRDSVKNLINILMDNAVKYTTPNGKIVISLTHSKNKTILSISNTGSNVPDADSGRVFERFYRADESRSREGGGSGLGLAIAKNIANANKWKIYANSKFGESMTITVLF